MNTVDQSTYDVAIIGSGMGGLACGALLAKAGRRVCVLERSAQPGGCLQSYRRDGLSYDTGLHYVGGLDEGQPLHRVFRALGLLELPWRRMDERFDEILLGSRRFALTQGYDRFVQTLARDFPHQRQQLQYFVDRICHTTLSDMEVSAWAFLHECFQDELLIQVLGATAMRVELRRESLPLFSLAHALSSYIGSSWRLGGDGNLIVDRLIRGISVAGGKVLCRRQAEAILEEGGRAIAIRCTDGTIVRAANIISAAHPALLSSLLEHTSVRPSFLRRVCTGENTYGIFTLSLRLRPGALHYFNHNAYVFSTEDVWSLGGEAAANPGPQAVRAVVLSCRVPEDGSSFARQLDLLTPMYWSECQPWKDTTVGHRGGDYDHFCRQRAKACLQLAGRYLPGLEAAVERCYTSTPLTYRDYLGTPEGNAFGLRKDWRRPLQTFISVRTPLPNLFLSGQSLMLPGIEGTTQTAVETCRAILGDEIINTLLR